MREDERVKIEKYLRKKRAKIDKKAERYHKIIGEIKSVYGKTKRHKEDYFNHIKKFMYKIEGIIGKNVDINNTNVYLFYDTYVIDHDHNGYSAPKPMTIINRNNIIMYKKNHPFFKTSVLYYTNHKIKVDVFYDSITYLLLGYKERNKDFQYAKVKNRYLKINYSIYNKLKILGYTHKHIDISEKTQDLMKYYKNSQAVMKDLLTEIGSSRIANLKKVITDIQRYINKIVYNFEIFDEEADEFDVDKDIVERYRDKLAKIRLGDGKTTFLETWDSVKYDIYFQDLENKTINLDVKDVYLKADDASDYDYHGNLILFYIIREMARLVDYNSSKFAKNNIINFIIDIINKSHDIFNHEFKRVNFEMKRFNYLINSKTYVYDVTEKGHGISGKLNELTGEYIEEDQEIDQVKLEQHETNIEELEAIDMEGELDYEIDYMPGVNSST